MEHAKFCAGELYNAVQEKKYEMALSFLRGFREVFANSRDMNIRRIYTSKFTHQNTFLGKYFSNWHIQIMGKKRHWKILSSKTIQLKNRNPQSKRDKQPTQETMEDGQHLQVANQASKQAQFRQFQAFMTLHLLHLTQEKLSTIQMNHLSGLKTILEAL